jgi:hypothetical protein
MLDFTFRDIAIAAAIVLVLSCQFVDRQVFVALLDAVRGFW